MFILLYQCFHLFFQILERAEKNDQSRAVAPDPNISDHDVEIEHFCQYLKAQMKKVPDDDWMDFTVDAMMLIKRYCSKEKVAPVTPVEDTPPPKPTEEPAPEVLQTITSDHYDECGSSCHKSVHCFILGVTQSASYWPTYLW